ncbi:transcription initiation factor TFIID subunit 5-like [Oppia nitens]|uniref:transcription initiation factor TFIID subunit 5-like n=1 Tax=Oppia nitens TaxID=1686743 RepID=UPI0023DC6536|nr:transcription initiation factor TFIID subunit 5-like [Oppia nitens]
MSDFENDLLSDLTSKANHSLSADITMSGHSMDDQMSGSGSSGTAGDVQLQQSAVTSMDKNNLLAIMQFLKKNNLQQTEQQLRKETQLMSLLSDEEVKQLDNNNSQNEANLSNVLMTYKTTENPDIYEDNYNTLRKFVESSLDSYRPELLRLLYPVFVHMYLELVYNEHEDQAINFMSKFGGQQEYYYEEDIKKLSVVTKKEHLNANNDIIDTFRSEQNHFTLRLSRDSYNYLKRFLQEKPKPNTSIFQKIIQEHLYLDVYEGLTRTKSQVEAVTGGMIGEPKSDANKTKVFYGLFKEPDFKIDIPDMDLDDSIAEAGDTEKPKKKTKKKDASQAKKARADPNAPPLNRIPLPELRDAEQLDKLKARREALKALKLGPETLPSICFYTLLNAQQNHEMSALCADVSEDSTLLAAGFSDSLVRVWPLSPNKLKVMKSTTELELIDKECDDVLYRMMDDKNTFDIKILAAHSGPVYAVSFSPSRDLLLSCSEDSTIRLWSLFTWTNICCYKGHCFPVWDIKFSPHGFYFASASHDRTARLWATDQYNPLRLFAGHISDVDCIQFHPNSNYVATGSTDRSVRLWDVLNGQCVRYMTGHKATVYALAFENSGRYLVSGGADKRILFWDLAFGYLLAELSGHYDTIYTLSFSRGPEGTMLASGGNDDCIVLWDIQTLIDEIDSEEITVNQTPTVRSNSEQFLLGSYRTKSTYILTTHFTRRNLLLGIGIFH